MKITNNTPHLDATELREWVTAGWAYAHLHARPYLAKIIGTAGTDHALAKHPSGLVEKLPVNLIIDLHRTDQEVAA